jgi:hypothetical protein
MGQEAAVKRWHKAQTAASLFPFRHPGESRGPDFPWIPASAGMTERECRAFAHHTTTTTSFDGRKGRGSAGTDPSTFFPPRGSAMR